MISNTRPLGINPLEISKGQLIDSDNVLHQWQKIEPKAEERLLRYERGDLSSDPRDFACHEVIKWIEAERKEAGHAPLVMRCYRKGIQALTDAEAVRYLNSQANAGLRKHKNKTEQLLTAVDVRNLTEHQKRELEANQRKHAFILAAHQGARTQSLRMQRKGVTLPEYRA